ncbi:anti-sigma factor [Modestobacter marinus]|uniref:anti-sigma factor n=1 Tax=Modestobacter marinus TaxID=477641 RepID=UPI001C951E57|nr:anti-sigma factor [Modestobacter marinus]
MTAPQGNPGRGADHREWEELAVGWALHALEPDDEVRFTAHLPGCDRCARTVAGTAGVMAAMAADLPAAEPSGRLRDRLLAAVEEAEQVRPEQVRPAPAARPPEPAPRLPLPAAPDPTGPDARGEVVPEELGVPRAEQPPRPPSSWRRVLPPALVAASIAAVLVLGAWNVVLTGQRQAAETAAARQAAIVEALLAPGRATIAPMTGGGREVATVVARESRLQVVASGLDVNDDEESTYVVWGMRDGSPVALGTFDVVSSQMDVRNVGSTGAGSGDYDEFGISIEPGRQAPPAPTVIVATGEVTS